MIKAITKLWMTLLLLCVAGVVNAATEYEIDQKFTSVAALDGQLFAIVNETDAKAIYNKDNQNLAYDTYTNATAGAAYLWKIHSLAGEGDEKLENAFTIEAVKADGSSITIWGNRTPLLLNSGAEGGFDGCFVLDNGTQYGTDVLYGGAWEIEYDAEKGFALKNVARGGYFAGVNPAPAGAEPIYWTFCTLKEGGEIPDPVIEEPEAPLAEGEIIPDFFSICAEGGIPYGYAVNFNGENRAYPATYTGGARIFAFGEGGDFTRGLYFREGYVQYGDIKKLALEAGKKYIVHFNSAMWKSSGADMTFLIYKEGDLENAVLTQTIANTPDVNGSKDAVTNSTYSEIEFTPDADGNYILKWDASGWKEVLLANPGVKVAAAAPAENEVTILPSDLTAIDNAEFTGSKGDVNISCTQGTVTSDQIRVFKNQTITFSSTKAIKKIVFTCTANGNAKYGPGCFNEQEGYIFEAAGNTGTWEGSAASVSFKAEANQVRITQVVITLGNETVEPVHIANTIDDPYTIAKAVELIDAGQALDETVFVKGIISKIDSINAEQAFITYWISADGTTEGQQFECYKGKTMEGLALDAIEVGAEVIVTGKLTKYNDIYEFSAGNTIAAYVAPVKPLFADGKYYILNKGAQKYLAAGGAWGTHAALTTEGLDYTIAFADGKYTLDSQVSNGGASNFLNGSAADGPWNDGGAFGWTIAEVSEGVYTINNGTKFIAAGENDVVTFADDATAETAQWTLISAADRDTANLVSLEAATAENGVDATFFIKGANFNRNDLRNSAWTHTRTGGNETFAGPSENRTTYGCEYWNNTFEVSQTIENLPEGIYEFTIAGFATNGTSKIYANETEADFVNSDAGGKNFRQALDAIAGGEFTGNTTGKIILFEGNALKIGVKRTVNSAADWTVFDNARLTYWGAIPAEAFKPAYEDALAAAKAALADEAYAVVTGSEKTALNKAIEDYTTVEETAEAYKAAITALSEATTAFKAAKADYEALINAKESVKAIDFSAYPYASEAKIAAAVAALNTEATSAADAKTKAQTLFNNARKAVESNAMLEFTYGSVNHSDSIAGANADKKEGWTGNIGTNSNEGYTDGDGVTSTLYLDGGWSSSAGANIDITREVNLPAGKFILTATARGSVDLTEYTMTIAGQTVNLPHIGADVNTGVFGRGWNDAYVVFETTGEPVTLEIKAISENAYQWMSINRFRIAQFAEAGEDDPVIEAPEGKVNLIANGNLAGESVESFFSKEQGVSTDPVASTIVAMAGKNLSRGIVVKSSDNPSQAWDTQFWINMSEALPTGSKLHVEFDYVANKAAKASTQAHGAPGAYQHWAAIGDVNFTTEWQHFSTDIEVSADMATGSGGKGLKSIAFNLSEEKTATEYRFDNFGVWAEIPEPVKEWENIIVNSDMEGDDNSCFYVTEQGVGGPFLAPFTAGIGVDGSKAVKVQSADAPANTWDTQFFIRLPYQLPAGTSYKVSFDYKAAGAAKATTQMHANPGDYIHYVGIGDVNFTTDWQTFEFESVISGDQSKDDKLMQSIAFNLAELTTANTYIFDNVKFYVPKDVVSTLTLNPAVDPTPYPGDPDGITTLKYAAKGEGVYNLNGQKVMKTQKGLYIMNGKKVVIK